MTTMRMKTLKNGLVLLKTIEVFLIKKISQYEKQTIKAQNKP